MKSYFVYFLACRDESFYTGVTNNIERRIREHQSGFNQHCYTYRRRPVVLVFFEEYHNVLEAISREKQIKGWSRNKKKALINGDFDKLREYSKSVSIEN